MIRARRSTPAGTKVILGLSAENIVRLKEGNPILVKADEELRLPVDIVIFTGETEVSMCKEMEDEGLLPPGSVKEVEEVLAQGGGDVNVAPPGD